MSVNSTFQMVNERGWRMGFANLFHKENRDWWRTRRWWITTIVWLLLINGIAYGMLWTPVPDPSDPNPMTAPRVMLPPEAAVAGALGNLVIMVGLFTPIGAIIAMQGTIIDEKRSGTAAWIMSKPASRSAFILSKLLANAIALLLVSLVVQWAVAYVLFAIRGSTPPPGALALGVALLGLHLLFYVSLTLMLGTLFNDRGPVIAIPVGILFAAQFVMNNFPTLSLLTPWPLIFGSGADLPLVNQAMMGMPLTTLIPIIATSVWIVVFVVVAIWRFGRDEF